MAARLDGGVSGHGPPRSIPVARPCFGPEEQELLCETLASRWVTQGPRVEEFERRFAEAVEAREAVAVSSGTAALFLALHAHGIGPGDEVIVPSLSFIATANCVTHTGARPVFADVDPDTYNLDPESAAAAITPRTRALMPVHQLGLPADLDALEALADRHGLLLVEDAACAVGSRLRDRPIGASGHACCFSFHARKLLVTGEGGMITTGDPELAGRLRRLRHQGMSVSDLERHRAKRVITERYDEIGYNFRMSDLHAAVGIAQLAKLEPFVARRRALAARYDAAFADLDELQLPSIPLRARPNYQSYIARLPGASRKQRDRVLDALLERGVATRRGLMAAHREAPYRDAAPDGSLPHSEAADAQTLILPIFHELSQDDQDYVIAALRDVLGAPA
jgi:dTDP-4-amino-4,6-dideoxygalactose transaminase